MVHVGSVMLGTLLLLAIHAIGYLLIVIYLTRPLVVHVLITTLPHYLE